MVSGLEQVKISHIYREANQCADLHVNHARTQRGGFDDFGASYRAVDPVVAYGFLWS